MKTFRRGRSFFFLLAVALLACTSPAPRPTATPNAPRLEIATASGTVIVRVEIVDTPEERQRGLMGRTSLDEDAGMLFIWPADTTSSFYMKDTLIPLSIAFIGADGRILRTLDMEPCRTEPCPLYDPETSYRMALEVRQGSFDRWGVGEGDRAALIR